MITFNDWVIDIDGPLLGHQYDNLSRSILVTGIPEGYSWELLIRLKGNTNTISLKPMDGGVGALLKASDLSLSGSYNLQLRGVQGEVVRHTNVLYGVYVSPSISGSNTWPTVPTAVEQALQRLEELNQNPPYPGDNGYWMVWDLDTNTYIESQLPLPPVAEGPAGKAATIEVGTTTTGDPGTEASVENVGTENAAVLNFTIPAGAIGPTGATPDISVQVSSLPAGSEPTVSVSGTPEAPVISLGIPAGKNGDPGTPGTDGQTPNITIGTVETLPAGSSVTAAITGQTPNLVLNLGIPQGPAGEGVPPTDGVPQNYVLTPSGWAEPQGNGEREWTLIADVTPEEDTANFEFTQDAQGNSFEFTDVYLYGKAVPSAISYWIRFNNQDNVSMFATYGMGNFKTGNDVAVIMEKSSNGSIAEKYTGNNTAPSVLPILTENKYESYTTLKLYFQGNWPANTRMMIWGR